MRLRRRLLAPLLLSLVLACGCGVFGSFPASLEAGLVNDSNQLLVLEGTARLPDSAPVFATLRDGERTLGQAGSTVEGERFFLTLDVSLAPGNRPLLLEVAFDPRQAPERVLRLVGPEGRWMVGSQVHEEEDGRYRVVQALNVVLPMSRREAAIRLVRSGDLAAGIAGLESVVALDGADREARAWLALARLQRHPGERQPGSPSHQALAEFRSEGFSEPLDSQVSSWLSRLDREAEVLASRQAWEQERRRLKEERERERWRVRPGRSMAGVDLGMEGRVLFAAHPPARVPEPVDGVRTVVVPDLDVEVELEVQTNQVIRIRTTSPGFRLSGDLGVGAPLLAFRESHPDLLATLGPIESDREGRRRARGQAFLAEGLVLEYERTFEGPGLAMDVVVGMSVVAPGQALPPASQATP